MGWIGWCCIGALIGLGVGWEREWRIGDTAMREPGPIVKLALLAWLCLSIALEAETVRGFLILSLSCLGAYQAAKIVSGAATAMVRIVR